MISTYVTTYSITSLRSFQTLERSNPVKSEMVQSNFASTCIIDIIGGGATSYQFRIRNPDLELTQLPRSESAIETVLKHYSKDIIP